MLAGGYYMDAVAVLRDLPCHGDAEKHPYESGSL